MIDLIQREIGRFFNRIPKAHVGLIDSWDATNHAAKVKHATEVDSNGNPRISGWIPARLAAGGANGSWVIGPTPGDQVIVDYLDGDPDSPYVAGFLHNDVDRAPVVQSGEAHLKTKAASVHIDASGNVTITTTGTVTHNVGNHSIVASGNVTISGNVDING